MNTTETIKVTAEHIANGKPGGANGPIELALKETHPEAMADVHGNWIHLCGTLDGCFETDLPWEAEDFNRDFEAGRPVEPVEFTVRWDPAPDDEDEDGR